MYNRLDRHVSPERKAFIESCRTAPRIQQETRFTFDPFESDGTNIEVQEPELKEIPKWMMALMATATLALVGIVALVAAVQKMKGN